MRGVPSDPIKRAEQIEKIRAGNLGKVRTAEHRATYSAAFKGKSKIRRKPLLMETAICANTKTSYPCPLGGATFPVMGTQRRNLLKGQRSYCSAPCRAAGHRNIRGETPGYVSCHDKRRRELGPASNHTCVDCPRKAKDWSLDASVPAERLHTDATGQNAGKPFSFDDNDYSPRCHSCHAKHDKRRAGY